MSQQKPGQRQFEKSTSRAKSAGKKTRPTRQTRAGRASSEHVGGEQANTDQPSTAQNQVSLIGRVSSPPLERELPSGDTIITFRLVLARDPSPMTKRSRQTSDWVDCVVWGARSRRSVKSWKVDDVVEVDGALRRRFFRTAGGASTRVEVEVLSGRAVARAGRPGSTERAAEAG